MKIDRIKICCGLTFCGIFLCLTPEKVNAQSRQAEIFIGDDKGVGQSGKMYPVAEGKNDIFVQTSDLKAGVYLISFRIQDEAGRWTPTVSRMIYVCDKASINGAEYFVDEDPGKGKGVSLSPNNSGSLNFSVSTGGLAVGPHTLTVRTLGDSGNWDSGITKTFLVTGNGADIEWFYDSDPGVGKGNLVPAESGTNVIILPTSKLLPGPHLLSIRSKDSKNRWTPTVTHTIYVTEPSADITEGEYFVDDDPGVGKASGFKFDGNGTSSFVIPTSGLKLGVHYLTLRGKTTTGEWVVAYMAPFEVKDPAGVESIVWKMTFNAQRDGDVIILKGNEIPSGSRVEILTVSGLKLHEGEWKDGETPYSINIDANERNLILTITSPDGLRTVKRIR